MIPTDGKEPPEKQAVDDAGNFRFTSLRPGKYQLFAWEEVRDEFWQDPEYRKAYAGRASEVTVGAGETQSVQLRVITLEEMK